MAWWQKHHDEYDVNADDAGPPKGFDDLVRRFDEAVEKQRQEKPERAKRPTRDVRAGHDVTITYTKGSQRAAGKVGWSESVNGVRTRTCIHPSKPRRTHGDVERTRAHGSSHWFARSSDPRPSRRRPCEFHDDRDLEAECQRRPVCDGRRNRRADQLRVLHRGRRELLLADHVVIAAVGLCISVASQWKSYGEAFVRHHGEQPTND